MPDQSDNENSAAWARSVRSSDFHMAQSEFPNGWMYLGEAVAWVITRGEESNSQHMAQEWDSAERELFDYLDSLRLKGGAAVEGYKGGAKIYEPIPDGAWARMNKDDFADPTFSPIDDAEETELGGNIKIGDGEWHGVRVPIDLILKKWPSPGLAEKKANATSGQEKRAVAALAEKLKAGPEMHRKAVAQAYCKAEHGIGPTAFKNRVWPQARVAAGLSAHAPAGRPRKGKSGGQ